MADRLGAQLLEHLLLGPRAQRRHDDDRGGLVRDCPPAIASGGVLAATAFAQHWALQLPAVVAMAEANVVWSVRTRPRMSLAAAYMSSTCSNFSPSPSAIACWRRLESWPPGISWDGCPCPPPGPD